MGQFEPTGQLVDLNDRSGYLADPYAEREVGTVPC